MSFGPSTALHPPAHIHKYALADAPCIRTKIRRDLAHLFFAESLSSRHIAVLVVTGTDPCVLKDCLVVFCSNDKMAPIEVLMKTIDITLVIWRTYGLTRGQASPTSEVGMQINPQPQWVISRPFNPLVVALALE